MESFQETAEDVSTAVMARKEHDHQVVATGHVTVRFDAGCTLCVTLAEFMRARVDSEVMTFAASGSANPEQLVIEFIQENETRQLSGHQAWLWLLEHHPSLSEFNWIAQKLGIAAVSSHVMMRGADLLRRLCFRCR